MRGYVLVLPLAVAGCVLSNPDFDINGSDGATDTSVGPTVTGEDTGGTGSTTTTTTTTSGASDAGTVAETTSTGTGGTGMTTGGCMDGDDDGICDVDDNCPEDANGDQLDGDGDAYGDVCDVCVRPGFDDDGADYDDDGVPCALDPCPHDGPNPPSYTDLVGPAQEITISNATINGEGNFVTVAAGSEFTLNYQWAVNFCECPGCYTQGMVGMGDRPPGQCFYNWGNEKNCTDWDGDASQKFIAPDEPGLFYLRAARTWDFECRVDTELTDESAEFAAICVK